MNPVALAPAALNTVRVAASVGGASVAIEAVGISTAAISASTILVATGGAAALVLAGYGIYRLACK